MVVRYYLSLILLSLAGLTAGCRSPCGGVPGSCMVIELDSAEDIDVLELKLRVKDPVDGTERVVQPSGGALLRVGRSDKIRLLPPPGVESAQITAVSLLARRESGECFQYNHTPIDWPSGTTQSLSATFQIPPRVTGLTPTQGPTSGGKQVELQGENFSEGMEVLWGSAAPVRPQVQNPRTARTQSQAVPAWTPGQPTKVAVRDPAGCQTNESTQGFQQYATPSKLDFAVSQIALKTNTLNLNPNDAQFAYINNDNRPDIIAASSVGMTGYVTILFADSNGNYNPSSNRCDLEVDQEPVSIASGHLRWPRQAGEDIALVHAAEQKKALIIKPSSSDPMNCGMMDKSDSRVIKSSWLMNEQPNQIYVRDINNDTMDDIIIVNDRSSAMNGFVSDETRALVPLADADIGMGLWHGLQYIKSDSSEYPDILAANYFPGQLVLLGTTVSTDSQGHRTTLLTKKKTIVLPELSSLNAYPWDVGVRNIASSQSTSLIFSRHLELGLGVIQCGKGVQSCPNAPSSAEIQALRIGMTTEVYSRRMVQADFDGNGSLDIAFSHEPKDAMGQIVVMLSNEDGSLNDPFVKAITTQCSLRRIDAHDMDADGKADLIVTGKGADCGGGSVLVLRNISQ